VTGGY